MIRSAVACALLLSTFAAAEEESNEFTIHAVAPALREFCSVGNPTFAATYDPVFEQWSTTFADRIAEQESRAKASAPAGADVRAGLIRQFRANAGTWDAAARKSRCEFASNAMQLQLMQANSDGPSYEPIKVACALKTASAQLGIVADVDVDVGTGHVSVGEMDYSGTVTPGQLSWDTKNDSGGYKITIDRATGDASLEHTAVGGVFKGKCVTADGGRI